MIFLPLIALRQFLYFFSLKFNLILYWSVSTLYLTLFNPWITAHQASLILHSLPEFAQAHVH